MSGFLSGFTFEKLRIEFVLQPESLGMGNAILSASDKISNGFAVTFPFLLNSGDLISGLIDQSTPGGALAVGYTDKPWLYGVVTLDGKRIKNIVEKPEQGTEPSNLYAVGVYNLSHEYLAFLNETPQSQYSFEEALDKYLQVFEVQAVEYSQAISSLKYPWHLFDFQKNLFADLPDFVSPHAHVAKTAELDSSNGAIYIEAGAKIGHCCKIVGPCYIGKDVFIGDFSLIRESSFEEKSSVGVHSDVTRSIIMEHSSIHNGFLGDSIIGRNVKIGAGIITSNKRMDRKNIVVSIKGMQIDRGTDALGTVVGDNAHIGIRVNIMPGKFIGCRSIVYPATTIWEHVPHDAVVKHRQNVEVLETQE